MDSREAPLVSVVSLTHNRRERIAALLSALREQDYAPFEVIVVDNASTDGTAQLIEADFPEVRLVRAPGNMGTYSYSLGIQAAEGAYLLMMDDDGLPAAPEWISKVVARFEVNPRLGAVACTVRMWDTGLIAHDSPQFVPEGSPEDGYPCVAYNGTGAGLRMAAVKDLMPVYPRFYFRSWIELHLCTRLLRSGWDVRHFPGIEVWHCRSSASSAPVQSYYGLRNYYWYAVEFYPWPHWLTEMVHHLGSGMKEICRGRIPLRLFLGSLRDAVAGMPTVRKHREPISPELLAHLRQVRRHGNWHGIAPAVASYPVELSGRT